MELGKKIMEEHFSQNVQNLRGNIGHFFIWRAAIRTVWIMETEVESCHYVKLEGKQRSAN